MFRFAFLALLLLASLPWDTLKGSENAGEISLTREGQAAIAMAQEWLIRRQQQDGSFGGGQGQSTAVVASATLALMVSGNLPGEGPLGLQVGRGVQYLLASSQPSGLLDRGGERHVMYHHGLATLCLAEVWGQSQDPRVYPVLKKAITLIESCQNHRGGWRYEPRQMESDDLSVTVMQVMALRAAKDAGMPVNRSVIERAVGYVESCRHETDEAGGFSYQPGGKLTWSTTAAGVASLLLAGEYKAFKVKKPLDFLLKVRLGNEDQKWFLYGNYYAAMALYHAGGQGPAFKRLWLDWYPGLAARLMARQIREGPEKGGFYDLGDKGPEVWRNAFAILILGVPFRYLPVYQR